MASEKAEDSRVEGKTCQVCGDAALGYNFNAVTCESCKAFFRRNAPKEKGLQCPFKERCEVTVVTRRFCQKCRLRKCLKVGMKRELIMTEEDKERKRAKVEARRAVRAVGVATPLTPPPHHPPPPAASPLVLDKAIQVGPCALEEEKLEGEDERMVGELEAASRALEAPLDQEVMSLPGDEIKCCGGSESLLDVINLTAVAIRRLIKMCKRIWEFRGLRQADQLSLLKHGCTQMMLLRSVVTFDPDRNSWKIPHTVDQMSRIRVEVLKEAPGNLYEAHEAFLRSFDPRAASDINIINMLTAVTLFDPDRPNLCDRPTIRKHQERYYDLLERYLERKHCAEKGEARRVYRHVIHKMGELHRLNEDHVRVYLDVNPSHVEPLLIEIFDLKPH